MVKCRSCIPLRLSRGTFGSYFIRKTLLTSFFILSSPSFQGRRTCAGRHSQFSQRKGGGLRRLFVSRGNDRRSPSPGHEGVAAHFPDCRQDRVQCAHYQHGGGDSDRVPHRAVHLRGFSQTPSRAATQIELVTAPRADLRQRHHRDVLQASVVVVVDRQAVVADDSRRQLVKWRDSGSGEEEEEEEDAAASGDDWDIVSSCRSREEEHNIMKLQRESK